jgi:hypothetical protein
MPGAGAALWHNGAGMAPPRSAACRRESLNTRVALGPRGRLAALGLLFLVVLTSVAFQTAPTEVAVPAPSDGSNAPTTTPLPVADGRMVLPTTVPASEPRAPALNLERVSEPFRPTLVALLTAAPANAVSRAGADEEGSAGRRGVDLSLNAARPTATTPLLTPAPTPAPERPQSDARGPRYAGWAMVAYPWMSADAMREALARQKAAGANVVWIGHNNPGEVDAHDSEPGLSYAVFEALQNEADPRRDDALAIVQAQERMLQAVRAVGLKAVLPVGYQSQMGSFWDDAHPDALRLGSRGGVNYTTAVANASFYSPDYRRDIRRYYEWVDARFVRPFRDVILMLNLADEPSGGDFSPWADAAFRQETGYGFADVGTDPERQTRLGEFQSRYIVDYATWSAQQWAELEPGLPVTMSFEGATLRVHLQLPHLESLFARTPPNFVVTFDAYPRDGPYDMPIDDTELVRLFQLVRTAAHYSVRYERPFWLWSTGNSWGLAQASPQPGNVADAVANAYYLALLARQMGGWLQGIAVWNYNVVGQGLYNDTHRTAYDPDVMFARVSETFPRLRQIMASPPGHTEVLVLAPDRPAWQQLGAERQIDPFRFRYYDLHRLIALARNNIPAAVVGSLAGEELGGIRAILVLARAPQDLTEADLAGLQAYLARGGKVVALRALSGLLGPRAEYIDGDRAEEAFAEPTSDDRVRLWQRVLGIEQPLRDGYFVATTDDALFYTLAGPLEARLVFNGRGWQADRSGNALQPLQPDGGRLLVRLDKGQYAFLTR